MDSADTRRRVDTGAVLRETVLRETAPASDGITQAPGTPDHDVRLAAGEEEAVNHRRHTSRHRRRNPVAPGRPRAAAFFDLDKTIIATSSTMAFARSFYDGGLLTRTGVLRAALAQLGYLTVGADHEQTERMKAKLAALVSGWEAAGVERLVAEGLQEYIEPVVYAEALDLIAGHRAAGRDVVIISASTEEVVRPISEMLGADHAIGSRLAVADGRYTGQFDYYAYGPAKAEAVEELAVERGYDLSVSYAYSDSVTDLPLLTAVGRPTAVNPDKHLRRAALERGWPISDFARPVRLRPRITSARWTAGAAVTATATAAVLWWLWRRPGLPGR